MITIDEMPIQLSRLLSEINEQIDIATIEANRLGYEYLQMRDRNGAWPMINLNLAKAQVLNAMTALLLNERSKS